MTGRQRGSGRAKDWWDRPGASLLGATMSEKQLDKACVAIAKGFGITLTYHTYRSTKSEPGFPDRVFVGAAGGLIRELKTEDGTVTEEQQQWIDGMRAIGWDAAVWRPADLFSGRIARELRAIAGLTFVPTESTPAARPRRCFCLVTEINAGECTHQQPNPAR